MVVKNKQVLLLQIKGIKADKILENNEISNVL